MIQLAADPFQAREVVRSGSAALAFHNLRGNPNRGPDESNRQATTRLNNAGRIVLSRQSDTQVVAVIFSPVRKSPAALHPKSLAQNPGNRRRVETMLFLEDSL